MTLQEIIYNCKNLKAGGKVSDDSQISDSQYAFIINYYRAQLIRNQVSKSYGINQELIQTLNPSKIILTQSQIEKCEYSTQAIPSFIESTKNNLSTYVGNEGGVAYQRTTYSKSQWDKYGATSKLPKWYEIGNKIVVRNHNKNLKLKIQGLFENPQEVLQFNEELDEMNPFNFTYPISATMLDAVYKMIIDSELRLVLGIKQDNLNDGREQQGS